MTRSTNMNHVEMLRELRDTGDVSDWRAMESALDAAVAALSAPTEAQPMGVSAEDRLVLMRLRDALPDVGLNGWIRGVEVINRILAQQPQPINDNAIADNESAPVNDKNEWVLVPREPTQAMLDAGHWPCVQGRGAKSVWATMLVATPLSREHGSVQEMFNPSAPVGVEGLQRCGRCKREGDSPDCTRCGGTGWRRKCDDLDCAEHGCCGGHTCYVAPEEVPALAQQPAADRVCPNTLQACRCDKYTPCAAQQPAACAHSWHDYGKVNRAWCSRCNAVAVIGHEDRPYGVLSVTDDGEYRTNPIQRHAAVDEAMVERIAALLHEEATDEPWAVAGVEHDGPDRDYYRTLARKVIVRADQQPEAAGETAELVGLLVEVRSHFTRDDDLPDDLLPRIDAALAAQQEGGADE